MSTLTLYDRVKESTTTSGTGTVSLLGAQTGFTSFAATVGNGGQTYYVISDQTGAAWEVGIGTYTTSGSTLSRTTVLSSSNSGSLVPFGSNTKDVFVACPASILSQIGATAGTVTSVATGTGLTGGPITSSGTVSVASGGIGTTQLAASAITYAKVQNVGAAALLGNPTGSSAACEEITLGTGLAFSGTTLVPASPFPSLWTASSGVTVANTTSETTLLPTGVGSTTIPANLLSAGTQLDLVLTGYLSTYSVGPTINFNFKLAGSTVATTTSFSLVGSLSGAYWEATISLSCYTTGSSGTCWVNGKVAIYDVNSSGGAGDMNVEGLVNTSATTINTTTTNALDFTATWSVAKASNSITLSTARFTRTN